MMASAGSDIFRGVIEDARKRVLADHKRASSFDNPQIVGDERSAALANFIRSRLPDVFEVAKGKAIDCFDARSGQLDFFIYDKLAAKPILQQYENALVPCESLYVVVEVKSVLNKEQLRSCIQAAAKVRALKPYKQRFVDARTHGKHAEEDGHRVMYVVFAYATDLSSSDWLTKELLRLEQVASEEKTRPSVIDRIFVESRGILNPIRRQGKNIEKDAEYLFVEFFLHIVNFLQREHLRREPVPWSNYGMPKSRGWKTIRQNP